MMTSRSRLSAILFMIAGSIFEIAAILPIVDGERMNVAFLAIGIVFVILGVIKLRRGDQAGTPGSG